MLTTEMIHKAADEIDALGAKPGPKNVRERLGDTGSYTTIVRALETWRSSRESNNNVVPFEMPAAARAAFERLTEAAWVAAATAATAHFDGQRAGLQTTIETLTSNLAEAHHTVQHLAAENSSLESDLIAANNRAAGLHDEVVALRAQVELLKEVRPMGVVRKRGGRKPVADPIKMASAAQASP